MSLSKVFASITDPTQQALLQTQIRKNFDREIKSISQINPFVQTPENVELLEQLGIPSLPPAFSTTLHSHPACKAIENYMLRTVGRFLDCPVTFMFIKPEKFGKMQFNHKLPHEVRNIRMTAKDHVRYKDEELLGASLCIKYETLFMHDTLHYYDPDFIGALFDKNKNLQKFFATVVIPPEIEHRHPSLYPTLYEVRYGPNYFSFLPDNHAAGAYQQSYHCLDIIRVKHIRAATCTISCTKLETKGAHHLMLFTRGDFLTEEVRVFPSPHLVQLPELYTPARYGTRAPFQKQLVNKLIGYSKKLKQCTEVDLWAKLQQIVRREEFAQLQLEDYTLLIDYILVLQTLSSRPDAHKILERSILVRMALRTVEELKDFFRPLMSPTSFMEHQRLLALQEFSYDLATQDFNTGRLSEKLANVISKTEFTLYGKSRTYSTSWFVDPEEEDLTHLCTAAELPCPSWHELPPAAEDPEDPIHGIPALKAPAIPPGFEHVQLPQRPAEVPTTPEAQEELTTETAPAPPTPENLIPNFRRVCHDLPEEPLPMPNALDNQTPNVKRVCHDSAEPKAPSRTPDQSPCSSQTKDDSDTPEQRQAAATLPTNPIGQQLEVDGQLALVAQAYKTRVTATPCCKVCAADYAQDLHSGNTGTLKRWRNAPDMTAWADLCLESDLPDCTHAEHTAGRATTTCDPRSPCVIVFGAAGSGKSHAIQSMLRSKIISRDVTIIVPTQELKADWRNKTELHHQIVTFEKALLSPPSQLVIVDEIGRYPSGYIDLIMALFGPREFIFLGDPRQSVYHESNPLAPSGFNLGFLDRLTPFADQYRNYSFRCPRKICDMLGMTCLNDRPGEIHICTVPKSQIVLTPTMAQKAAFTEGGYRAQTYSGCQGLTVQHSTFVIEHDTFRNGPRSLYTALTRHTDRLDVIINATRDADFAQKVDDVPEVKALLESVWEPKVHEPKVVDYTPPEVNPRTHIPVTNEEETLTELVEGLGDKNDREIFTKEGYTNCVQTENEFVQCIAHQQAKDEALFSATCDVRLATTTPEENYKEFRATEDMGLLLFLNFKKAMSLPEDTLSFEPELWTACRTEIELKYLEKPKNMILNAKMRQDLQNAYNDIAIFQKSQWVKKPEKFALPKIKAGQTICAYQQWVVMRTATLARYMRRLIQRYQPENLLINCEVHPKALDAFVQKYWHDEPMSYANDYTAFDLSQDGAMLNFEVMLQKFLGVPEEETQFYIDLKMHAKTFLGVLTIMRLTGEGPTFDANTWCNIAYQHTRFHVPVQTPQMYAGDDMVQVGVPQQKASWPLIEKKFKLQAKPEITARPTFTGWRVTKHGVVKDPLKLYMTMKLAQQNNTTNNVKDALAIDINYAYRLGDKLYDIFDDLDMRLHHIVLRRIHKWDLKPVSDGTDIRITGEEFIPNHEGDPINGLALAMAKDNADVKEVKAIKRSFFFRNRA
ncbi:putative RNA-dependent RNA polymerase [Freshwater macrophyte associated alphaflexi-like virus 1]|nr:putative RNA-dependent RNA polymerase [Freshwater macrophyte associated alphaflexi-like virus 1]